MSVKSFAETVKEGVTRYTRGFGIAQAETEEAQFASVGSDGTVGGPGGTALSPSVVSSSTVSPSAGKRPVASGSGVAVTFEPVTEYDARMDFGVKWDGITDDTAAMENAIATVAGLPHGGRLRLPCTNPSGAYAPCKITAPLITPAKPGFEMVGMGKYASQFKQYAENEPIINMGGSGAGNFHSYALRDFGMGYAVSQPSTNTEANPIIFSAMGYQGSLEHLWFENGSYAIAVASGIVCPWGSTWDDLEFNDGLTGGAMDFSASSTAGVPNLAWGRMFVSAKNMVGPIFRDIYGYNWTWDALEIIEAELGPQLIVFRAGSVIDIGALKLEQGAYGPSFAGGYLIDGQGSMVHIAQLQIPNGGAGDQVVVNMPGNKMYVIHNAQFPGGVSGKTTLDVVNVKPETAAGTVYLATHSALTPFTNYVQTEIGSIALSGCLLQDSGATQTGESLMVRDWVNGHITQDNGDANYTAAVGLPSVATFNTAFTAQRTVTLPGGAGAGQTNLHNGLTLTFIFNGAINGPNNALFVCNSETLLTVTEDKVVVEYTYRRSTSTVQAGWVLTRYASLEAPAPSRLDRRLVALGLTGESFDLSLTSGTKALTSEQIEGTLLGFVNGDVITNLVLCVGTLATGTEPTAVYVGVFNAAGERIAVSADLKGSTIWTAKVGYVQAALTAKLTIPATGGYYCAVLLVGSWGTTALKLLGGNEGGTPNAAYPSGLYPCVKQTGQKVLPTKATFGGGTGNVWFGWN